MKKSLLKLAFGITALLFGASSYAQTYTFTNCGATGRFGPTQSQVNATYTGPNTLTGAVTINTQGYQEWTVPVTGSYSIEASGAQGAMNGGQGAIMKGEFNLIAGEVIKIAVGQVGVNGSGGSASNIGGGGGGGSFVVRAPYNTNGSILVIAGGGGGFVNSGVPTTHNGVITTDGGDTYQNGGGNNGNGGNNGVTNGIAAGGGGFFTDGVDGTEGPTFAIAGHSFQSDLVGGSQGNTSTTYNGGDGGFGGGGGGWHNSLNRCGGAGGYSGGQGGTWSGQKSGGGGGSYNNGTNQVNTAGSNSGMGQVVITLLCSPLNLTVTPADTVCFGTPVTITGTSTGTGTITWDNGITNGNPFPNTVAGVTTYTSTSTDPNDCVSQVVINVLPELTGTVSNTICNEGSVVVNGNTYDANTPTGTEVFTNVGSFNCDSTVTVNLNVLPAKTGSVTNTICNNGSVIVNGNTYDANTPTGTEVFTNVGPNNCDSTVTVNLNVLPAKTGSVTDVLCDGDSVVVNGTTYNAGNLTGTEVFTNIGPNNCDSTVTVNITVLAAKTGTVSNAICDGDSVVINGTTYNAGNPSGTEIFTNVGPSMCDSTVTVNLTINPLPTVAIAAFTPDTVCETDPAINLPAGTPASGTYSGNGVVGTTFDPNTAGVGAHYVVYSFTDGNTCTAMDSTMIVVVSCVGVDENGALAGVNIYPNPTNNIINITLGTITSDVNLTLTSIEGKVVYQENNVSENQVSVDLSNNSKGIYFLKVETNNKYKVYKVIKE